MLFFRSARTPPPSIRPFVPVDSNRLTPRGIHQGLSGQLLLVLSLLLARGHPIIPHARWSGAPVAPLRGSRRLSHVHAAGCRAPGTGGTGHRSVKSNLKALLFSEGRGSILEMESIKGPNRFTDLVWGSLLD